MTGRLEIVGADAAPVCEDGVCEIPPADLPGSDDETGVAPYDRAGLS